MSELDRDALRAAYSRFLATPGRILLTGHSHQAWPDVVRDALGACFDDAARHCDDKWSAAVFPTIQTVGEAVLDRMGFPKDDAIAFGRSTHELLMRLVSCLPIYQRHDPRYGLRHGHEPHDAGLPREGSDPGGPKTERDPYGPKTERDPSRPVRIVTTQAEFHSMRRQLTRLAEEGVDVVWVDASPRERLAERLLDAITPGTDLVAFSAVLFEDAYVLPRLGEIIARAVEVSAIPLVDAYHAFNVVPLDWGPAVAHAFVTAGGYKYAAFGEGICWLRIPQGCTLRPVDTGWFADFGALDAGGGDITYGPGGARFAGATFDPTPFYRAHATLAHWERFGLTPERLRALSLAQTDRILARLDEAGLADAVVTPRDPARRGGFIAVRAPRASDLVTQLRAQGVFVDARGDRVRLGPAPYLTDAEIDRATTLLAAALRA
ncbi:aminotransferase class V-fold PLP-dependent enzyme [Chondromyces crocatus]|uniref:Kynureninase n=1 Tax=Chondromyces crocatus TaxID=52 RepID=A0A0K1EHY1_CHOCO|nr:aminotransferase class V-fold PLP-dependent enzyme [Chondromyces crocatus]AKT40188.1 kynureninase [Chondromyces crocatus]